jgi:hypothetical protein
MADNYLPGLSPSEYSVPDEPHKLSPEAFEAHPYAVFHGSHYGPMELNSQSLNTNGKFIRHYGTLHSAIERLSHSLYKGSSTGTNHIYSYWNVPTSENFTKDNQLDTIDDNGANIAHKAYTDTRAPENSDEQKLSEDLSKKGSMYYTNSVEDPDSLSLVSINKLKTQSDYVREAIAQGRENEVHPRTRAEYYAGTLGHKILGYSGLLNQDKNWYTEKHLEHFDSNKEMDEHPHPEIKLSSPNAQLDLRSPFEDRPYAFLTEHPNLPKDIPENLGPDKKRLIDHFFKGTVK